MSRESAELHDFGIDSQEMQTYMNSIKTGIGNPDRQVCICGHPLSRHTNFGASVSCSFARAFCGCRYPFSVLETQDLRPFAFNTSGMGKKHALSKGLYSLHQIGKSARWIIDLTCFRCHVFSSYVIPVALTPDLRITDSTGEDNAFLCDNCIQVLGRHYSAR